MFYCIYALSFSSLILSTYMLTPNINEGFQVESMDLITDVNLIYDVKDVIFLGWFNIIDHW